MKRTDFGSITRACCEAVVISLCLQALVTGMEERPSGTLDTLIWQCTDICNCSHTDNGTYAYCNGLSDGDARLTDLTLPSDTTFLSLENFNFHVAGHQLRDLLNGVPLLRHLSIIRSTLLTLENGTFGSLTGLESLTLDNVLPLSYISSDVFRTMTALTHVCFRDCEALGLEGAYNATLSMPHTLHSLILDNIEDDTNHHGVVPVSFFKALGPLNLRELVMSRNRIAIVPPEMVSYLADVQCLVLQGNMVVGSAYTAYALTTLQHLRFIDVSFQGRSQDHQTRSFITPSCVEPLPPNTEVGVLDPSVIQEALNLMPLLCEISIRLPGELRYVFLSHLTDFTSARHFCVHPENHVRYIDFSHNTGLDLVGQFLGFLRLQYFNLQYCHMTGIYYHSFAHAPSVTTLLLGGNVLGKWFAKGNATTGLRKLSKLSSLDLADNQIASIEADDLQILLGVKYLNLSMNSISEHSLSSKVTVNFTMLNMSANHVKSLPDNFRDSLDNLYKLNKDIEIDLTGNPFVCDCSTRVSVRWMLEHRDIFSTFSAYRCTYKRQSIFIEQVPIDDLDAVCLVDLYAHLYTILISCGGVLFMVTAVFGYRWRKRLKYIFWFLPSLKWHSFGIKRESYAELENEDDCPYDAFVVYSFMDRSWVLDHLRPRLEEAGIVLCISDRDFPLAEFIPDVITWALTSSRCVVLIISRHLLSSVWCDFETTMAVLFKHKILLIVLDDPPIRLMPPSIYYLYKRQTRLSVPPNITDEAETALLDKLIAKIKQQRPALNATVD